MFAATSTHPGFFLYLQSLRLLVLCVLLAMWFSSGLLLHRIMMVVGWNLLAHSNQTFTLLINVDLLFATSSPFLMTILLTQKEASIIPDILWYMLILFDNFTMDEDISRACSAGPNFKVYSAAPSYSRLMMAVTHSQSSQPSAPVWYFPASIAVWQLQLW